MSPFQLGAIIAGVVVVIAPWGGGPSVILFEVIDKAIRDVQIRAMANVRPSSNEGEVRGFDENAVQKQIVTVAGAIRFIYTVEEIPEGLLHTVSSQLQKPKSKKYHLQCMLVVKVTLNGQLSEAGTNEDEVKFDVYESPVGTQYVSLLLTYEQHQKFRQATLKANNTRRAAGSSAALHAHR